MSHDALKLTTYFGERDRAHGAFAADALAALYARHELRTSIVLRGALGFGVKHHLHSDRLLTLSEDLPIVSVAVDDAARVRPVAAEAAALLEEGLVTTERAQLLDGEELAPAAEAKLTLYLRRGDDHRAAVACLQRHGVAGATVLLGVDGTAGGARRRARFFGANADVPVMVISVGASERLLAAAAELGPAAPATVERVRVCRRDGAALAEPEHDGPPGTWQKIMVYGADAGALVRGLRGAGAAGATVLRGVWGYHGDHAPHGDVLWQVRRRVPQLTIAVDVPERVARWWPVVEALTARTGLVTSELVPALRAGGGRAL